MALENKKLRVKNKYDLNDQTIEDKQNANKNDSVETLIKASLITAGGVALYKTGLLKDVFGGLKTLGSKFAETSADSYHVNRALKNWANGSTGELLRPSHSLFNAKKKSSLGYDIWQDLKESFSRGEIYSYNVRRIINDTAEDINVLNNMISKETKGYTKDAFKNIELEIREKLDGQAEDIIQKEIKKAQDELINKGKEKLKLRNASLKNTSIIKNIKDINSVMRDLDINNMKSIKNQASTEMVQNFIEITSLTDKAAQKQIHETNYRALTLGDLFEGIDRKNRKLIFKEGLDAEKVLERYKINFNETINSKGETVLETLENFLTNEQFKYKVDDKVGTLGLFEDVWKKFKIDEGLNINEDGKVINFMMGKDALRFFASSLRKDFGLPVLGFNPLDSALKLTPFDKKINNRSLQYGVINGIGNYSPYISGKGTRYVDDINKSLQKRFDKPDEDFHLLFIGGNVHAIGTKGTKELIGENFNLYDISGANKKYQLPHEVNMLREMGGYDLNRDLLADILDENENFIEENLNKVVKDFDRHMSVKEFEKTYGIELTPMQKIKYEIGRQLDIGYQEFAGKGESDYFNIGDAANVDNIIDDIAEKVLKSNTFRTSGFQFSSYQEAYDVVKDKTYEMAFGATFKERILKDGTKVKPKTLVLTKQGIGISDLIQDVNNKNTEKFTEDFKGLFAQYFSGFDKNYNIGKYYNEKSSKIFDIFNALDSGLSNIGLGLSLESKRSTGVLVGNLLTKRALPAYMLTQIPGMIDYFSEPIFTSNKEKKEGKTDTLTKTFVRDVMKPIDIGLHKMGDISGFTKIFKYLQEMTPGSDQFTELPVLYQLGLGQTAEERKEYIEKGYDPVRKNRYWSVSNTPFTGSKIEYWRPNIYRRIEADVKYSDSKYGSRKEYYQHTWYPNLVSPMAPIRHFITDSHHWDKKHYHDRPYAETAPKGENLPLIGPAVSGTIGQIYRKKMHKEYWDGETLKPVNPEDEKPSQLLATGQSVNFVESKNNVFNTIKQAFVDTETFNKIHKNTQEQYHKASMQHITDLLFAKQVFEYRNELENDYNTFTKFKNTPLYDNSLKSYSVSYNAGAAGTPQANVNIIKNYPYTDNVNSMFTKAKEYSSPLQTSTLPYRDYNRYDTALDVYTTPSGQVQVVDVPENLNLYKVNEEIKHYSLNKIYGTNQRVNLNEYNKGYEEPEAKKADNYLMFSISREFNDLANIYGLKGFLIQTATGEANVGKTMIDTSSYAYSANRTFWDQNLGGLGGELSEIGRRFIHKKEKNTEYLNPIRNTMPTWMPGSSYFTDFLHGDPYAKIKNGEERLPGEGYERLNNIDFSFNISASMLGSSRSAHVKHFLHQDTNLTYEDEETIKALKKDKTKNDIIEDETKIQNLNKAEEIIYKITNIFKENKVLLDSNIKFHDQQHDINGVVDAKIKDFHSKTGEALINIRGVSSEEFKRLEKGRNIRNQDYYEMNYDLYQLNNIKGRGYIYYYDQENPDDIYKARVKFNRKDLRSSIQNLNDAKTDIYQGLKSGEISRGDLYSLVEKYKILADTAPYSQEFKDISSQVSHAHLSSSEKEEIKAARERMEKQKNPLRVYDYKFSTADLKSEKVTVKKVIDNNTLLVEEYGKEHAIKFAGINVSESNSTLYKPTVKEKKEKNKETGRDIIVRKGKTMNEAARDEISKYLKPGSKITISYDADEFKKFNKDSTQSIKAVIESNGVNINRKLVKKGLAKEKETDDSPAAVHVKYSKGDIAFGSMMEKLMHGLSHAPIIGDKIFHIRSPYEEYRKREVYNKDFKSWNHPIRDYLVPTYQDLSSHNPVFAAMVGGFLGSLMGKNAYGKMMGTLVGASLPAVGSVVHHALSTKDREYIPKRRRQQEEVNEYYDMLKYVKNTKLYNQYKELAKKHDHFDVDKYLEKQEKRGKDNKERKRELDNYKRLVKLDFKHRGNYNFKYGEPKYEEKGQSKKEVITAINKELAEISNDRKVEKLPLNAIKAISYKQAAKQTMYGFEPGDDIRNIMAALPKKERQYYSKLVEAPKKEKEKILRIAPKGLRRALQSSWGMKVDEKENLVEYFSKHALPDENWIGWQEDTNLEDVKVKIVNQNGLDPGEFDIWSNNKQNADQINIPIPKIHKRNNPMAVQAKLNRMLNNAGLDNIQIDYSRGISNSQRVNMNLLQDSRNDVSKQISNLDYEEV